MNKEDPPKSLGVFSPVGHVVISFPTAPQMDAAAQDIEGLGLERSEFTAYTPEQVIERSDRELAHASPLANLGQEINLVRAHRALAERGYSFLVVHAPKDELAHQVADIAKAHGAERAQLYGRFVIEELIDEVSNENQVFESPDRGLDAQTVSGKEKERSIR